MNFTQPPSVSFAQKRFLIFLVVLSLIATLLGGIATSRYGAGVASDSVKYMAVAQSLLAGNGLFDHRGLPLLSWPPLYSIILAGLSLVSGLDVFVAGWWFNVFLLGLNLFLSGVIFWRIFQTKPLYAYLASGFVCLSISSLRIHATIFSEPLYLTMTLGLLIVIDGYIRQHSRRAFIWMVALSALAPMLRYVGLAVTVTGLIVILIENRKEPRIFLRDGFILGGVSIIPIGWWLVIRNIMTYGTLFGTGDAEVDVYQNTSLALTKILHWFVPYLTPLMPILTRPFILLFVMALLLWFLNRKRSDLMRAWAQALMDRSVYPTLIYGVVYFVAVVLTIITGDHQWLDTDDRYYVILLVPVALLVVFTYDILIQPHLPAFRRSNLIVVVLFVLWSVYPLYGMREYLATARTIGEPSGYNHFNGRAFHESNIVIEMQKLRIAQPDAFFYGNYVDAVWFYTRKPVQTLPTKTVSDFTVVYAGWPHDKPGYIVWFKPNEYKHYLSPDELSQFSELELMYSDPSGDIYYVRPR
ncbi:MAG: hypothetical protein ABI904_16375 [Chloroflexota bacterium]